jgi:predicted metal-dependent hydrolase
MKLVTIALLLIVGVSGCGRSRIDQCDSLVSVQLPETSAEYTPEKSLKTQESYLSAYKALDLNDGDLKQLQSELVEYYGRSVQISKDQISLRIEMGDGMPSIEQVQKMMAQTNFKLKLWKQLKPLLDKAGQLCPDTVPRV